MVNETPSEGPKFSERTSGGAILRPISSERKMRVYAVPENELTQISSWNSLSILFASIGSAFLSVSLAIVVDSSFEETLTPLGEILLFPGAPIIGFLSVVFFIASGYALKTRGSIIETIKRESEWPPE